VTRVILSDPGHQQAAARDHLRTCIQNDMKSNTNKKNASTNPQKLDDCRSSTLLRLWLVCLPICFSIGSIACADKLVLGQDQKESQSVPLTVEEFQKRAKNKDLVPFITELDKALEKTPSDPSLLGLELQVDQLLLMNERGKGIERFRGWISKLEKLPRSNSVDKLLVAGVFNATVIQDVALANEFISWIDAVSDRIPQGESITQANLRGNRLSLQGLVEDKAKVEAEFSNFIAGLQEAASNQRIPPSVLASQSMRYKSLFWTSHREQSLENLLKARQTYKDFLQKGKISPQDLLVYIQFMTTFASELTKELPRDSYNILTELKDQLRLVQPKLPEDQSKSLETTIKSLEQGLKQLDIAIRQLDLVGTRAPAILDAKFLDVPEELKKELKGKVTLLVFWAAWSEPCLKSLPRIEKIRNEFKDQELVVIGVTKSYGIVWDEPTKTVDRQAEIAPEAELQALKAIANHYSTSFGLAVVPETSKLFEQYLVSGIPQLVLIDSDGTIKLIRPGITEAHFSSIETEARELFKK
jgi:thiol-disulfide isomerase/thioredoxin